MTILVDALREVVRGERRAWPFRLDCRDDVATIELGGKVYRVRPMRWREKRNLARYARLGEEFVRRHFVKVCLVEDAPLPTDREELEVLLLLARWINAPGEDDSGLPLDSGLLANVTMALSRDTGARQSDLEMESADLVEQLWRDRQYAQPRGEGEVGTAWSADGAGQPRPAAPVLPDPGEMNRIVVLPDPPAEISSPDTLSGERAASEETVDRDLGGQAPPTGPAPRAPAGAASPDGSVAWQPGRPASEPSPPARFRVRFPGTAGPQRAASEGRSRAAGRADSPISGAARPASGSVAAVADAATADGPLRGAPEPVLPSSVAMRVEPSNPAPTPTISEHDPAADSRDLSPDIGALPRAGTRWPPTSSHSVGSPTVLDRPAGVAADFAVVPFVDEGSLARPASHSSSLDVDGLFEEWAERLEDAAEQLGIDLED